MTAQEIQQHVNEVPTQRKQVSEDKNVHDLFLLFFFFFWNGKISMILLDTN